MTRKDYVLLSAALREARALALYRVVSVNDRAIVRQAHSDIAGTVASALGNDNPNGFETERFMRDAGAQS